MTAIRALPLQRRFARHIARSALLDAKRSVVVALSGGLDSVCLLHLLRFGRHDVSLHAAHFDHALRCDSAADAAWVRGLCRAWGVPLTSERAARIPRGEADARTLRYEFLERVVADTGAHAVLTAHHADDQAETLLFRMARGTGLGGLRGIASSRGNIVRPLLPFTRRDLLAYAAAVGLRWREDSTNTDLRFARNRVRHTVLPALEAVRPGATRRIARLAERAAEAESAWRQVTADAVGDVLIHADEGGFVLARDRLLTYHPHVRARVIRHLLRRLGSRPDRSGTRSATGFISSGSSGSGIDLAGGVSMRREFGQILLHRPAAASSLKDVTLEIHTTNAGAGSFVAGGQAFVARWAMDPAREGPGHVATFDPTSLRFPLELRAWRPGERIRMPYGRKKLKKLLQERRVGRGARARVPVLADATGEVLWVIGHARAEASLPQPGESIFSIMVLDGESF